MADAEDDLIETAAAQLTAARLSISLLPKDRDWVPKDLREAHDIATRHAEMLAWDVVGWKVGSTSALAMQLLGTSEPFPGRIFEGTVHGSEILQAEAIPSPKIESEFAFLLGKSLPPRDTKYTIDEVRDATLAVAPAFEIVCSRFEEGLDVGALNAVADSGCNAGTVLGAPVLTNQCPTLSEVVVDLSIDKTPVVSGTGSDILGDPWRSLEWLANHLSARQIGLRSGMFVLSGTCTGAEFLEPNSTAHASFAGLGDVHLRRTGLS